MDQPASDSTTNATHASNLKVITNAAMHTDQKKDSGPTDAPEGEGQPEAHSPKHGYWQKLVHEKPDRHIELLLTLAITFFAAVQLFVSCNNNASTGQQTDQLIAAAKVSAFAAQQNLLASQNFAQSAQGINQGVQDAVGRLQAQARTAELARESANENAQEQLRQTVKIFQTEQRPWLGFQDPQCNECVGKDDPTQQLGKYRFYQKQWLTIGDLSSVVVNTGKTPATNVQIHYLNPITLHQNEPVPTWEEYTHKAATDAMSHLPPNPSKGAVMAFTQYAGQIRGTTDPIFALPPTATHTVDLVRLPGMLFWRDAYEPNPLVIYVLGKITYSDPVTRQKHLTTLCLMDRYWQVGPSAFSFCETGNSMD